MNTQLIRKSRVRQSIYIDIVQLLNCYVLFWLFLVSRRPRFPLGTQSLKTVAERERHAALNVQLFPAVIPQ